MTVETLNTLATRARADELLAAATESNRAWEGTVERLRSLRRLGGRKPGGCALHETIAAARPAMLAALERALGGTLLVIVPTPDAAERSFADLLYYLGERSDRVALLRSREEGAGAIESPSETSARTTLLADLTDGLPRIVLAPISAVRQHVMPRRQFDASRFELHTGDEAGWENVQRRLFELGYERCDVVSAVGEYAVRGGIIDLFAATADAPVRVDFFGDRIESMREFAIESQRSSNAVNRLSVAPWVDRVEDATGTIFEYLPQTTVVVMEEPATIGAVAQALDDERARERHTLSADESAGPDLLERAGVAPISLHETGEQIAAYATLVLPGGIESQDGQPWVPPILESLVFESLPVEHFNRQISLFSEAMREWTAGGENIFIVSAAVSRTIDLLRAAGIDVGARTVAAACTSTTARSKPAFAYQVRACACSATERSSARRPSASRCARSKRACPLPWPTCESAITSCMRFTESANTSVCAPKRFSELPKTISTCVTPAAIGCSCPLRKCIRLQSTRRPKARARASPRWGAPTGHAPKRASRNRWRKSPTIWSSSTPSERCHADTRSAPTPRGRRRWKRPSRTSRRPINRKPSRQPRATWSARVRWTA